MRSALKIARRYLGIEKTKGFLRLPQFFLPDANVGERLLALAHALGSPSTVDGGKAIWDIKPSAAQGTFSETIGAAGFHTDGAYLPEPPAHFLLACIKPAVSGGVSLFLPVLGLMKSLEGAGWSTNDIDALRAPSWSWCVPAIFQSAEKPNPSIPKPIISENGQINWREDNLAANSPEQELLAKRFARHLKSIRGEIQKWRLSSGDAVICSNRFMLHGRTAFSDPNRHFLRVRIDQ